MEEINDELIKNGWTRVKIGRREEKNTINLYFNSKTIKFTSAFLEENKISKENNYVACFVKEEKDCFSIGFVFDEGETKSGHYSKISKGDGAMRISVKNLFSQIKDCININVVNTLFLFPTIKTISNKKIYIINVEKTNKTKKEGGRQCTR